MPGVIFDPDISATRYEFQKLARLKMIIQLEADIRTDMEICALEGWDQLEYIKQLQNLLNRWEVTNE